MKAGGTTILTAAWAALATNLASVLETKGIFVVLQVLKRAVELELADVEAEVQLAAERLLWAESIYASLCTQLEIACWGSVTSGSETPRWEDTSGC